MSDDEMMARFFASYVSPSERPRAEPVDCTCAGPDTHAECALVEQAEPVEPALPEGWTWSPKRPGDIAYARCDTARGHLRFIGIESSPGEGPLRFYKCTPGEFPEVERYVLWRIEVGR